MIPVTVIIPVYNSESHLRRCIKSILAQTHGDFELILVNDGSTDNSGTVCDEYANSDGRIKVIHQENAGASSARNVGINLSQGEWIVFVDADDEVTPLYLESLLSGKMSSGCPSLVMQGLTKIYPDGHQDLLDLGTSVAEKKEMVRLFSEQPIYEFGFTVGKLYNRSILKNNHIYFDTSLHYAEDMIFMLQYLMYIDAVVFIPGSNYLYHVNTSSLSQRYNSHESEFLCFERFIELNEAIAKRFGFKVTEKSLRYAALQLMRSIYALYVNRPQNNKIRLTTLQTIRTKYIDSIKNHYLPNIILLKILKVAFVHNVLTFDILCRIKFRKTYENSSN